MALRPVSRLHLYVTKFLLRRFLGIRYWLVGCCCIAAYRWHRRCVVSSGCPTPSEPVGQGQLEFGESTRGYSLS